MFDGLRRVLSLGIFALITYAAPIEVGSSAFSAGAIFVDFDMISAAEQITTQYSASGVTFTEVVGNNWASLYYPSPMQASNFYGACGFGAPPCRPLTMSFSQPVVRVGLEISTNPGTTYLTVANGSLAFSFTNLPVFVGLEDPAGFSSLTIDASATDNGAIIFDNLRFELLASEVPEPGTFSLLGGCILGVLLCRLKCCTASTFRRKAAAKL